jgi:large subunit ribosomal protein L10
VNRADKNAFIDGLNQAFQEKPHIVLAAFKGLTVNQANDLRRRIGAAGGDYRVIKNRLAKRAAKGTPAEQLSAMFAGPCAVATHADDPVVLAKTFTTFAKENPQIELRGAVVDGKETVDAAGANRLATLPGLSETRAQLLALFNTPATMLVRLLGTPGTQIARAIDAKREKDGGAGG